MHPTIFKMLTCFCLFGPITTTSADPEADKRCQETEGNPQWQAELNTNGHPIACSLTERRCFKGYTNASTGNPECCPENTTFTRAHSDDHRFFGACCAAGQEIQIDQGVAGCCDLGKTFEWDPKAKQSFCNGDNRNSITSVGSGPELEAKGGGDDDEYDYEMEDSCTDKMASPRKGLGIRYGKCYTLKDTSGSPLGRNYYGAYCSDGCEIKNLIFRVCKSTSDCHARNGREVPYQESWVLQDQKGSPNPWWWSELPRVGPYLFSGPDTSLIAPLNGKKHCNRGRCSVCIRLARGAGIQRLIYSDGRYYLASSGDPESCVKFFFEETPCLNTLGPKAGYNQVELGGLDGTDPGTIPL